MAFTPVVMNNLHTYFVNPNNLQPDADGYFSDSGILDRVPFLFIIMGAVQGGILLIGLLLYQEPPPDMPEETEVDKCSALAQTELDCEHKTRTLTFQEDSPVMSEGNSTSQKIYGQTFIDDDTFLTTTGSSSGCVHVVLRVLMGLIQDKISFKYDSEERPIIELQDSWCWQVLKHPLFKWVIKLNDKPITSK
ncbi:uncharacterized protein LOC143227567 [Tachypleus tridentatus]|uniref:uncharacterized protein LOC143227567 n=1 Tax=Tachypleus tridentatus TaxID=6853 RepID=UPI003FD6A895